MYRSSDNLILRGRALENKSLEDRNYTFIFNAILLINSDAIRGNRWSELIVVYWILFYLRMSKQYVNYKH